MTGDLALTISGLSCTFGGVRAIDGLSLGIQQGETRCIIGPNGAGKTTLLNVICGLVRPSSGRIQLGDQDITGAPPARIARMGILRSFQTPTIFPDLPVSVNLELGASRPGAPAGGSGSRVEAMMAELGLSSLGQLRAESLSQGERKRLELGMVLVGRPTILMLDEPTAGMSIRETDEIVELLRRLTKGMTVIVIEHDMSFVRQIADKVTVLHRGSLLVEGSLEDVQADRRVQDVYLGAGVE